jgi:perosamine synthetase
MDANENLNRREFLGRTALGLGVASSSLAWAARPGNPNALALKGGTPVRTKPFPNWPQTAEIDEKNILKSLRNHHWCTYDGEFIPRFEKAWAQRVGTAGCVMTPCGTHALHTALTLLDISPGDEVIVSPYTYIATIDVILLNYALPVFADTDLNTFQIDPDDIEHRITEQTRALLPVHIFGEPAHMDKILAIARKHNLPVIEDACQAHTAEWRGKKVGSLGTIGSFSFQETKVLPGGEAGALVSNNKDLIAKAYSFRDFGRDSKRPSHYKTRGTKYRISDFPAAVLMAQLTRLDELCAKREKHAAYLKAELKEIPGIMPQEHYPESTRQTCLEIGLRYDSRHFSGVSREQFAKALQAEGIPVGPTYYPLNKEAFIEEALNSRGYRRVFSKQRLDRYREQNHLPRNDELCATELGMDQHVLMGTQQDVDDILEACHKVSKNAAALA